MASLLLVGSTDSSGGAGLGADWSAAIEGGHFGPRLAVSAVTVQDADRWTEVEPVSGRLLERQLEAAGEPAAVKIGLLGAAEHVSIVAAWLSTRRIPSVFDPVLATSAGARLASDDTVAAVVSELLPAVTVATPNRPECRALAKVAGIGHETAEASAAALTSLGCAVLLKGGHQSSPESIDLLFTPGGREPVRYVYPRRHARPVRGTGCRLAAGIAIALARGETLTDAVEVAGKALQEAWSRGSLPEAAEKEPS